MAPRCTTSPPSGLPSDAKPQPRPPRSPAQSAQIRIHNRRREYLERHPDYFKSIEHEFADPLLYDTLVRRFQTAAEREAEGRKKGYGRILEGSIARSEERHQKAAQSALVGIDIDREAVNSTSHGFPSQENMALDSGAVAAAPTLSFMMDSELVPAPQTKEQGQLRWRDFLRDRFVNGGDDDFEYPPVDENDELDTLERKDQEEAWFDDEDPGWASDASDDRKVLDEPRENTIVERPLEGETGVQDY